MYRKLVHEAMGIEHIPIGGAAMIMMGSSRATRDIDLLVPRHADIPTLLHSLQEKGVLSVIDGDFYVTLNIGQGKPIGLDILTRVVNTTDFGELYLETRSLNGVATPSVEYLLAIKLNVIYLREDDKNGVEKVASDASDLVYLANIMVDGGLQVSKKCGSKFAIGYYHMIFVRVHTSLQGFDLLIKAGIRNLLLPWVDNSEAQQEYYTILCDKESDPITVSITELEENGEEGCEQEAV